MTLEQKHGEALKNLQRDVEALRDRITSLEAREQIVVVEAKGAASAAASNVVSN
jgi:chaperonin cofactor prefoldin